MSQRLVGFDKETGELLEDVVVLTKKQIANSKKRKEAQEQAAEFRRWHGKDNFIMYVFSENCNLSDLTPQTATRLIYLATWLEYDGEYLTVNKEHMTREQMEEIMLLKPTTFKSFLKEITEKGYLIKENKAYRINKEVFQKGEYTHKVSLADERFVRVYIKYIRHLYELTPQSKHVHLGYIFQLIPYINCEYNVLCHNPLEKDPEKIIPMTVGEFCEAIGYDVSQASRLLDIYDKITFEVDGKNSYFCGYTGRKKQNNQDRRIIINPFIFFAGSDEHKVEVLKILFV